MLHLFKLCLGCCELILQLCNVAKVCILPLCKVFFSIAVQLLQKLNTFKQELRGGISSTGGRHLHSSPHFTSRPGQTSQTGTQGAISHRYYRLVDLHCMCIRTMQWERPHEV